MAEKWRSINIWHRTYELIREVAYIRRVSQVQLLHDLVRAERRRLIEEGILAAPLDDDEDQPTTD